MDPEKRRRMLWYGALGVVVVAGLVLYRLAFVPSETEVRAFLQAVLRADGRVSARGADGVAVPLEAARIAGVEAADCAVAPGASGTRGRNMVDTSPPMVCRYTVVTGEGERFTAVLRAQRQARGGPAEAAVPGSLVDPARYRVGAFVLRPVGVGDVDAFLGAAAPR